MMNGDDVNRQMYKSKSRRNTYISFRRIYLRSYCLVDNSFEILLAGGKSLFYHFCVNASSTSSTSSKSKERRDTCYSILYIKLTKKVKRGSQPPYMSSKRYFETSQLTRAWQDRQLSNFDYLMALNTMAGRSYNDLSQYPIFPWILSQYNQNTIDLTDPKSYRDLRKPIGALNKKRLDEFRER